MSTNENESFKYLALDVLQTLEGLKINQDLYIPLMTPISMAQSCMTKKTEELTTE